MNIVNFLIKSGRSSAPTKQKLEKIQKNFQKPLDKFNIMCYNSYSEREKEPLMKIKYKGEM